MLIYDSIVVGAGPAGLTAAMYIARAGKKVLVLGNPQMSQIVNAGNIENYPGIPSVSGSDFIKSLSQQVTNLGVEIRDEKADKIQKSSHFAIFTDSSRYESKTVVMATGAKPAMLHVPGEQELLGNGISTCALCDGFFYSGASVAIIGGGNTALKDAIYLSDICEDVTIIIRRNQLRGEAALQGIISHKGNIHLITESTVSEFVSDGEDIQVTVDGPNGKYQLSFAGVFLAVGSTPETECMLNSFPSYVFLNGINSMSNLETIAGLFVAGDCRKKVVRQLATAVGDGAIAGSNAIDFINAL